MEAARARPAVRCPFCREDLSGQLHACGSCGTTLHEDCRLELGRCPTLGCHDHRPKRAFAGCECCWTLWSDGPCPCDEDLCGNHRTVGPCAFCRSIATRTRAGSELGHWQWVGHDLCADCTRFIREDVARARRQAIRGVLTVLLVIAGMIACWWWASSR